MIKANSNDIIPSLPPGVTLTTLDNGLTIIVRGAVMDQAGSCFQKIVMLQ